MRIRVVVPWGIGECGMGGVFESEHDLFILYRCRNVSLWRMFYNMWISIWLFGFNILGC